MSCNFILPEDIFEQLLTKEEFAKYQGFLRKAFINLCPTLKYCPAQNCDLACENPTGEAIEIHCDCDHRYCYGCNRAPHFPIDCVLLQAWLSKTEDGDMEDAASLLWIKENSKPCPKCTAPCMR